MYIFTEYTELEYICFEYEEKSIKLSLSSGYCGAFCKCTRHLEKGSQEALLFSGKRVMVILKMC